MVEQRDAVLTFGLQLAAGSATTIAISPLVWIGFVCGVVVTLVSAAIAIANFE
jgi:hypothetical protein